MIKLLTSLSLLVFVALAGCDATNSPRRSSNRQTSGSSNEEASSRSNGPSAMNAEFRTMSDCLKGIKKNSGHDLKIVTDTPNNVSGFLSNGQGFGCEEVSTGTKGTYVKGWYLVE
jgi:hypothetical protein